jgi:hypothetical protein
MLELMETRDNPANQKVDNSIAAIMTMMLPGLGQLMKGQIMPGIFWALSVGFGYFSFFWPGLIIHGLCILDAAFNKGDNSWIGLSTWPRRFAFIGMVAGLLSYIVFRNF